MRLIDADKLDKYIKSKLGNMAEYELFATMIDNQPTAYYVGEVENKLTESSYFSEDCNCDIVEYQRAVEIVKGGAQ